MSRFYDRVCRYGVEAGTVIDDIVTRDLERMKAGCPVVVANNVTEYFYAQTEKESFEYDTDIPNMAPIFNRFFIETRKPTGVLTHNGYQAWESYPMPQAWGLFVQADDFKETYGDDWPKRSHQNLAYSCETMRDQNGELYFKGVPQSAARWMIHSSFFFELPGGKPQGPAYLQFMYIDESGSSVKTDKGEQMIWGMVPGPLDRGHQEFMASEGGKLALPLWLAVSFTHCKNVVLEENEPPDKVSKKHQRRHGAPLTKYYTLEIGPIQAATQVNGSRDSRVERSFHIARGHFATYSPDKPLFGKYAGTFWKPQHVRGSKKSGEIVKDYAIKSPRG